MIGRVGKGILAFVLLLSFFPVSNVKVLAEQSGDYLYYVKSDKTVAISGYVGTKLDISIPAEIDNLPVTSIGSSAFSNEQLTSIIIPSSVISIGDRAFQANQLTSVNIPDSVTSIGYGAFVKNQLASVIFQEGIELTEINDYSFSDNKLTSVIIPSGVTSLGTDAFSNNQLTGVTIPDSVTNIGDESFGYNQLLEITIPDSVTSIGDLAFFRNDLMTIKIPDSVTKIGYMAFSQNDLMKVIIPDSVTSIGGYAFSENLLTNVTIPSTLKNMGDGIFEFNKIKSATFEEGVTSIADAIFNSNDLTSISIPNSVASIGDYAFHSNDLTNITIPDSVTMIGESAFSSNKLTSVSISKNVTKIGKSVFYNNRLTNVVIPKNVTSIGVSAFEHNYLTSVTIPEGVSSIGFGAFSHNQLRQVTIPESVTTIGVDAFANMSYSNYNYVFDNWYTDTNYAETWDQTTSGVTIYAKWALKKYTISFETNGGTEISSIAAEFDTSVPLPPNPTKLGYIFASWYRDSDFQDPMNFSVINVSSNMTLFAKWYQQEGDFLFEISNGEVTIVDYIGIAKDVSIPSTLDNGKPVKKIGNKAFINCGLTNVTIPNSVTHIGVGAFRDNELINVDFPNNLTTIEAYSFSYNKLTNVTIPEGVTRIGERAFENNHLLSVTIPESVTKIAPDALALYLDYGYRSVDWFTNPTYTERWNQSTSGVTLYAKWIPEKFTVEFLPMGGTSIPNVLTDFNTTIPMPLNPIRHGFSFVGWYTYPNFENSWNFSTDKVTGYTVLFAKWEPGKYTVTFNTNGGTEVSIMETGYATAVTAPTTPTKNDFTFAGWYTDNLYQRPWDFDTDRVFDDVTLYAKWLPVATPPGPGAGGGAGGGAPLPSKHVVTFNTNGGTTVSDLEVNKDETLVAPTNPMKEGYSFAGWYIDAACQTSWNFATNKVTGAITLYAKWTPNKYTVTFNSNGGTAVSSIQIDADEKVALPTNPKKTGHTFAGWYTDAAAKISWEFESDVVKKDTILYAKWVPNKYTVTFRVNGGKAISSKKIDFGKVIPAPAIPVKTGYAFAGWFKDSKLKTKWNFATNKIADNTTLYAKWILQTPTVNKVNAASTRVTGKTLKNTTVYVYRGKAKIGSAQADANGNFSVKISKQKAGTKLSICSKDSGGNTSQSKAVTVSK